MKVGNTAPFDVPLTVDVYIKVLYTLVVLVDGGVVVGGRRRRNHHLFIDAFVADIVDVGHFHHPIAGSLSLYHQEHGIRHNL